MPGEYADHETTGEMQVTYTGSGWKGVGGLYYYNGTAAGAYNAVLSLGGISLAPGLPPGVTQLTTGSVITNSVAAYFDTTWNLTSRLNLDVGARWNEDRKQANVYVSELYAGTLRFQVRGASSIPAARRRDSSRSAPPRATTTGPGVSPTYPRGWGSTITSSTM